VFSGFSDIAHLSLALLAQSSLTTIYGPDIINGFGGEKQTDIYSYNIDFFTKLVTTTDAIGTLPKYGTWKNWRNGQASGHLIGGWIDAVVNMSHPTLFPDFDDVILFWESIDLQPHNLNMLLHTLKISGLLNKVRGMIIGSFVDCEEKEYWDCTPTVKKIVLEVTKSMNIPILANVDFGHGAQHLSIPQGVKASMDSGNKVIKIRFDANIDRNLPWSFKSEQNEVEVKTGENNLVFYTAENNSDKNIIGTAVYNVSPHKAAIYFNKIQCFCFEEQLLKAKQKMLMPVSFFIDPEIENDKNLQDVDTITLSYTFYPVKE